MKYTFTLSPQGYVISNPFTHIAYWEVDCWGRLAHTHSLSTPPLIQKRVLGLQYFPAAAAAKLLQLCPTLCNPKDSSPPGSPIPGILQARDVNSPHKKSCVGLFTLCKNIFPVSGSKNALFSFLEVCASCGTWSTPRQPLVNPWPTVISVLYQEGTGSFCDGTDCPVLATGNDGAHCRS